jgi:hypothetical protein
MPYMTTWIEFRLPDGRRHPESDIFLVGPLAQLILECMRNNKDVFGTINPVIVYLSNDGTFGELHLAPDSLGQAQLMTRIPVTASQLKQTQISASVRTSVEGFFKHYTSAHRKE